MIKWLIVGRTATGKDYLAALLKEKGMKAVKSYSTRPRRTPDEDSHIFITKEEAEQIPRSEKVARTVIGEYEYFATRTQVLESDIYIIDPVGAYELLKNMPDTVFYLMYLTSDPNQSSKAACNRASDPEAEKAILKKRREDENEQFSAFEARLSKKQPIAPNLHVCKTTFNTFQKGCLERCATEMFNTAELNRRMEPIVDWAVKAGVLQSKGNLVKVVYNTGETYVTKDTVASFFCNDNEGLANIIKQYMLSNAWKQ